MSDKALTATVTVHIGDDGVPKVSIHTHCSDTTTCNAAADNIAKTFSNSHTVITSRRLASTNETQKTGSPRGWGRLKDILKGQKENVPERQKKQTS